MKKIAHTFFSIVALGMGYMTFGANEGCNVSIIDETGGSYDSYSDSYYEEDDTENKLTVTGSGEYLTVGYNTLAFTARINWENGLYFFSPDPTGEISGDKIICAASIDENEVEGDCFRSGRVCHFNYWHDSWTSVDNKDVYYLGTSTCKKGGDVGPFLVPLDSPLCGEDPFPTCPDESIFPSGPDTSSDSSSSSSDTVTDANVGDNSENAAGNASDSNEGVTSEASETQPSTGNGQSSNSGNTPSQAQ